MIRVVLKHTILLLALVSFGAMPLVVHVQAVHTLTEEFPDLLENEDCTEVEEKQSEKSLDQQEFISVVDLVCRSDAKLSRKPGCRAERRRLNGLGTYLRT